MACSGEDRDQRSTALAVAEAMSRKLAADKGGGESKAGTGVAPCLTSETMKIVERFAEQEIPAEGEYMGFSLSHNFPMITYVSGKARHNPNRKRNETHETLLARARRCAPRALDRYKRPITVRVSVPTSPKSFKGDNFSSSSSFPLSPIYKRFFPGERHDEDAEISADSHAWLVASWACPKLFGVLSFDRLLFTVALALLVRFYDEGGILVGRRGLLRAAALQEQSQKKQPYERDRLELTKKSPHSHRPSLRSSEGEKDSLRR